MATNETTPQGNYGEELRALGKRIHLLRKDQGISARQFAKMIGMSRDSLADIEKGRGNPRAKTLLKIAEGLEVPVAWLFANEADFTNLQGHRDYAVMHTSNHS